MRLEFETLYPLNYCNNIKQFLIPLIINLFFFFKCVGWVGSNTIVFMKNKIANLQETCLTQ